jgi:MFS family permease
LSAAECFGQRAFGRIYGPIYLGIRCGAAVGPLLFGLLATTLGSYRIVLLLVAAGLLGAAGGIRWAVPPQPHSALESLPA